MFHETFPWQSAVLSISWQHLRLANSALEAPPIFAKHVSEQEQSNARAYGRDKSALDFVSSFFSQIFSTFTILYSVLPYLWSLSKDVLVAVGLTGEREILRSIVFVIISMCSTSLLAIPFSLYKNFVIEQRYGFNKLTIPMFISEKFKEILLTGIIAFPVVGGLLRVIQWGGDSFFYHVWIFMFCLQVTVILIFPTVLAPLFNSYTPLPEGDLKTRVAALAKRVEFPLKKVLVVDGSQRSSHSYAYFTGFFKDKRIVLYDTLLELLSHEEMVALLVHELGHWKMNHMYSKLFISQVQLFALFYTFSHLIVFFNKFIDSTAMYTAFGFPSSQPIIIGLVLFSFIYQPIDALTSFLVNRVSRTHEFQADAYAKKMGHAEELKNALIKLNIKNLGTLVPDPWYSAWHYSHPPLTERLEAIGKTE
ncbi:peptidase family M48-domain-containing protein [Obelidium mucronatum]|nr:peptidase family M48-domain-containing protein [Obelidium mucronatum]